MKYLLMMLLAILGGVAYAQSVYQCTDKSGHAVYQDTRCNQSIDSDTDQTVLNVVAVPSSSIVTSSNVMNSSTRIASNRQQIKQQRLEDKIQSHDEDMRVDAILKSMSALQADEYARNRRRCRDAIQVAGLCGKYSGEISCSEKGFQSVPIANRVPHVQPIGNERIFMMNQCALQAATVED